MKKINIILFVALAFTACQKKKSYPPLNEITSALRTLELKPFYHGVASGDPMPESVMLWTRVTPETELPEIEVLWEIATDEDFKKITGKGTFKTTKERDYTVKVEATELTPNTAYFYRFKALKATSATGKTKTAAQDAETLKFAVVSCSNYEFGYFNAYGRIAEEPGLSAVVHLGDYIYEYGPGVYGDTTVARVHIPEHEILSLEDYRSRYSQYRLDPDLQAAHASHPFITIWDDHEITNNSYKDGAQNHQDDEGDYKTRSEIARKVYYEWMPIREQQQLYRTFSFGNLADVIMLDERLAGRTKQADSLTDPSLKSESRTMLGKTQFNWFANTLKNSKATWKIIGNQVIYSYLDWGYERFKTNLDAWDGYPVEQQKVADLITGNAIKNVIFITGDTHTAWAIEATNNPFENYNKETGEGAFAIEFGTTSINSGNANERFPTDSVKAHEQKIVNSNSNPHLRYTNMRDHGYLLLTLKSTEATADYKIISTLKTRDNGVKTDKTFKVSEGETKLTELISQ